MELYKENLIHKIEDDLAGRNKNWEALENHIKNISDEYDPAKTYQIGDYAIYENTLYRCISETNGAWNSSAWVATSVAAEIVAHKAEDSQKHITESGENANGRYIRFDDGTMICFTSKSGTPVGSIIDFEYILYGSTFMGTPIVNVSKSEADSQSWTGQVNIGVISNTGARVVFTNLGTENPYRANLIAIGRWK